MRVSSSGLCDLKDNRGFTLVEILIALLIGLFLMGALITIVQANRTVFGNQNKLAQMQDGERMAMTMIADVIQSAGYFPDPTTNTLATSLSAAAPFAVANRSPVPTRPRRPAIRSTCAT